MEERVTEYIECYLLHDPIGNAEGAIAEFETEKLVKAEQQGAVFIAVYTPGAGKSSRRRTSGSPSRE